MKKYFEIKLRLKEQFEDIYGIELETFYSGDGSISVEENKIEGYIALDYLWIEYNGKILSLELYIFEDKSKLVFMQEIDNALFVQQNRLILQHEENPDIFASLEIKCETTSDKEEYIRLAEATSKEIFDF